MTTLGNRKAYMETSESMAALGDDLASCQTSRANVKRFGEMRRQAAGWVAFFRWLLKDPE